ncbi:TIM barrel protein [Muricomes intestini]|uniref:TIM barrel protein n=1 Tax=Muricomes intestini TaxID=1796634 RepID=UPI002FE28D64
MSMKIALFTAGFSNYPIERVFKAAAKNGYDGIEIGGFRPHAYAPDLAKGGAAKIRQLSKEYGLPIVSYAPENTGSPYSLVFEDSQMNKESLDYFKLTLDMAKEIGSEYCMFACNHPGYGRNREDVKKIFIENMQILAGYAEKIEQTIILEPVTPYEGTIIVTSDDVRWALDQVHSSRFKCMLDLAAPFTCGEPICSYFEKMGEDVKHIHFVDCEKTSEDHLIPGDGEMDFPRIVSYLKEIGYDGYLSLELFSRYANEPAFSAERGYKVIRNLLDEN